MIILLLFIPLLLLVLLASKTSMKNRYTLLLAALSVLWWVFLVIGQLRLTLDCTPNDSLCNSGNTITGDFVWGTVLALYTLPFVWAPFTVVTIIKNRKK